MLKVGVEKTARTRGSGLPLAYVFLLRVCTCPDEVAIKKKDEDFESLRTCGDETGEVVGDDTGEGSPLHTSGSARRKVISSIDLTKRGGLFSKSLLCSSKMANM